MIGRDGLHGPAIAALLAIVLSATSLLAQPEDADSPGYVGVRTEPLPAAVRAQIPDLVPAEGGLLVSHVVEGSPADRGGLAKHDVLLAAGDVDLAAPSDLDEALSGIAVGERVAFRLVRGGKRSTVEVAVESRPANGPGGAELARAALAQSRAQVSQRQRDGAPLAAGPIAERSILVTTGEDGFGIVVESGTDRWMWSTTEGTPADLPQHHAEDVKRLVEALRHEREKGALRFRVQPRADGEDRSVVLMVQQPDENGEYRLLEIERKLDATETGVFGRPLPVERLLEIEALEAELDRLAPPVRERLEATLRRYRIPPVQARVRRPQ